ncbi:MAG: restriction endonuclease subunit S [Sulfolobales archaeon]
MTTKKLTDYIKQSISVQDTKKAEQPKPTQTRVQFKKETKFQETSIGKIPKEWKIAKLGSICRFKRGFSYRSTDITDERTSLRFITIDDIEKEGGLKRYAKKVYIKNPSAVDPEFLLDIGDLLIANTDMTKGFIIGAPILIKNLGERCAYSMDLTKLIFDKTNIHSEFLYYYLMHPQVRRFMKSSAQGTNVLHLNHEIIKNLFIPIPSLTEQKVIAEILSMVDLAIDRVRRLVERAEKLKMGLMQELLTKGIGHKEYKETPIGKIPKEWKIVKLSNIARIIMGQSPPSETYNVHQEGLPFLQGKEEFGLIYPKLKLYTTQPIKIAEQGDILIAVRAPVGDVNIAPFKMCIGRGLAALRFDETRAHNLFYFYYLQYIKKRIESLSKGTTFKAITKEDLENLIVSLPRLEEQRAIAEVLSTVDEYIESLRAKLEHLERVKVWLMDVLLTGKVRAVVESISGATNG